MSPRCERCGGPMKVDYTTETNVTVWACEVGGYDHPFRSFWTGKYGKMKKAATDR